MGLGSAWDLGVFLCDHAGEHVADGGLGTTVNYVVHAALAAQSDTTAGQSVELSSGFGDEKGKLFPGLEVELLFFHTVGFLFFVLVVSTETAVGYCDTQVSNWLSCVPHPSTPDSSLCGNHGTLGGER